MSKDERISEVLKVNRSVATTETYISTNLGIEKFDDATKNLMSATFGIIKRCSEALWNSVGLDPNVNMAYEDAMNDPDKSFEARGKTYYLHPGVGNLRAYNEAGNPSGGCFSMQTLA
jgi:hypothetical protein